MQRLYACFCVEKGSRGRLRERAWGETREGETFPRFCRLFFLGFFRGTAAVLGVSRIGWGRRKGEMGWVGSKRWAG